MYLRAPHVLTLVSSPFVPSSSLASLSTTAASLVPTAASLVPTAASLVPTPASLASTPVSYDVPIVPLASPGSSSAGAAGAVLVNFHPNTTIPHFVDSYRVPLESLRPTYYARSDGSLLTESAMSQLPLAKAWSAVAGACGVFFLLNTQTSLCYLRRSRLKDKTLFYLLLASQLLGLMSTLAVIIGDFDRSANCTAVGIVKKIFAKLSVDIMITGILGIKAYRCLGNARVVPAALIFISVVMYTLLVMEVLGYSGYRGAFDMCMDNPEPRALSIILMCAFIETCFLCFCFIWAIWRSSRSPADQARLTIRVSAEGTANPTSGENIPRGWWDYVPGSHDRAPPEVGEISLNAFFCTVWTRMRRLWNPDEDPPSFAFQRKPSLPGEHPIPQPPRISAQPHDLRRADSLVSTPVVSAIYQFIRYVPRMRSFRRMLRNELLYTTFLTVVFLVLGVLMLVGVSKQALLGAHGWIILDWAAISSFTLHSFGRVVRRHELEAALRDPVAWERIYRTELDSSKIFDSKRKRRSRSLTRRGSREGRQRRDDASGASLASLRTRADGASDVREMLSCSVPAHRSLHTPRELSSPSSLSSFCAASPVSTVDTVIRPYLWDSAVILPSPDDDDSSGASIAPPDVPLDLSRPITAPADARTRPDAARPALDLRTHIRTHFEPSDLDYRSS
ncbi:hypothetical protein AcW2_001008 [Taiwanofungus camphoratus]|nr:hypothetical protein AcW2_001008 [Antrodia cinnamomea]